jgi:hypothetical protein
MARKNGYIMPMVINRAGASIKYGLTRTKNGVLFSAPISLSLRVFSSFIEPHIPFVSFTRKPGTAGTKQPPRRNFFTSQPGIPEFIPP